MATTSTPRAWPPTPAARSPGSGSPTPSAAAALSQGSTRVNLRFPGQYYDAESGLHYNYFRDYDPETGRYVESDPMGWQEELNTYVYVENPLPLVDEWGFKTNGKHANKSSPMTVGDFNRTLTLPRYKKAIREAETNGKTHMQKHSRDY